MAETNQITFTYKEVVESLIKQQNIHEGIWGIYIRFGFTAANTAFESEDVLMPSAIVPVKDIGIQRFEKPNNLTVDASVVNPQPKTKVAKKAKTKKTK